MTLEVIQETADEMSGQPAEIEYIQQNYFVHALTIMFGAAPLLAMSAAMLQIPVLIQTAPEGWNLPSYVGVVLQPAIIVPLLYTLYQKYAKHKLKENYAIHVIFFLALTACVLAIFTLRNTMWIFGAERSVPLFVVMFLAAASAFASAVICLPYMGRFQQSYMYTFMLGEALSGFLPSILGMVQGAGGEVECRLTNITIKDNEIVERLLPFILPPRFDSEYFFIFILFLQLISFVAFICLDNLKICKKQYVATDKVHGNEFVYQKVNTNENQVPEISSIISDVLYKFLLFSTFTLAFITIGFNASIHSYALLPYGTDTLHLNTILTLVFGPISPIISLFLKNRSLKALYILLTCIAVGWIYILIAALMSPAPILVGTLFGKILVIGSGLLLNVAAGYVRIIVATLLRLRGGNSLMYNGAIFQIGLCAGTLIGFTLVNYTKIFVEMEATKC